MRGRLFVVSSVVWLSTAVPAAAQSTLSGDTIRITRAAAPVVVDGDLSDEAWKGAVKIEKWYEVNPGDNTEPKVRNVGYLSYDDKFFYAAFEFDDPAPGAIRAPYADRDNIGNGFNDYGGIIVDAGNTGHTATFFVVTPHNIQYDAVTDDSSGEDSAPDFFWESATRINASGWTLEMRIPFSSLRYRNIDPQTWGIMLYRNYPRDFHYQFFSMKVPRGSSCFVCRENALVGLEHLPSGGHLVAAPYVSASEAARPRDGLGTPLVGGRIAGRVGVDLKYTPNADTAADLTVKPDFSQVESDVAQISANERFALFFPEKRPFFLEGVDLFRTPIQAVYTRSITSPRWGGRLTGKEAGVRYTVLVADDEGGGSVILPGPNGSSLASRDFGATALIARVKRDIGLSSVGVIVTDREARRGAKDGGHADVDNGHNRVVGPDFQWRPRASDQISGQLLFSHTVTPNRPDLAAEWTGQTLASHFATLNFNHSTTHFDAYGGYRDSGNGFRADSGFLPQVGSRDGFGGAGWTFRPKGPIARIHPFTYFERQTDRSGALISRLSMSGLDMEMRWNGYLLTHYANQEVRSGDRTFGTGRVVAYAQFSPSRRVSQLSVKAEIGQDVDFANSRPAHATSIDLSGTLNPTAHLDVALVQNERRLNVDDVVGIRRRLFVARVSRVRGTYTFTSRLFVRGIAQYASTINDPSLYILPTPGKSGAFSGSALLAYKINWQSVMFVGYGDDRELTDRNRLEKVDRQFFVKFSYAFQR